MKAKATLSIFISSITLFLSACTTPVAIDPIAGEEAPTGRYRFGNFYAPIEADAGKVFKVAIREIDSLGYFRTGELHKNNSITIYARKVGDDKVSVRIEQLAPEQSELRIRIGNGDLPESQEIYDHIREAL